MTIQIAMMRSQAVLMSRMAHRFRTQGGRHAQNLKFYHDRIIELANGPQTVDRPSWLTPPRIDPR